MNWPEYIVVHHTGGTDNDPLFDTSNQKVETVDAWHRHLWNFKSSLGWFVGYHYFIDKTGKVTHCRADNEEGAHTKGMNRRSIGVCLAGNFDSTVPSLEQEKALARLLTELSKKHNIPQGNIVPHRRFANKTCYGRRLADDWAANLLDTEEADTRTPLRDYTNAELIAELRRRVREMGKQ